MRNREPKTTEKPVNLNEEKGDLFMMTRAQLLETVKRTINEAEHPRYVSPKEKTEESVMEGQIRRPITITKEGDIIEVRLGATRLFSVDTKTYDLALIDERDPSELKRKLADRGITFTYEAANLICHRVCELGGALHPSMLAAYDDAQARVTEENIRLEQ